MTSAAEEQITVSYEGSSSQNELWGGTQANFVVTAPGQHQREVAVLLPEAVATYLAAATGRQDSPESHLAIAREGGQCYLECLLRNGKHVAPFLMLARAELNADPGLLTAVTDRLRS